MAILNNSNAISAGGYDVNNSLRFRSSASAYLNRTPTVASNRRTWTLSMWIKRGSNFGSQSEFFTAGTSGTNYLTFQFDASNRLALVSEVPATVCSLRTTSVYRDPAAWYHITLSVDTTQATAANRVKIYVNGNQLSAFDTATYPSQNTDLLVNSSVAHYFSHNTSGGGYYDGYMADINFIDGSQKTPSDFGETDTTTGVWIPKAYTGTYGTNGFYLKFSDIATTSGSNAGLGKDFSGNANYWTTNNISVTSGTTYDAMIDSPTNASASGTQPVGNYAVLDPLTPSSVSGSAVRSISAGNLYVTNSGPNGWSAIGTTMVMTSGSGKWYWEVTCSGTTSNGTMIGIHRPLTSTSTFPSAIIGYTGDADGYGYYMGGNKYNNSGSGVSYGASYTAGDVIGVALDMSTAGSASITFYKNNSSQGVAFSSLTGDFFAAVSQAQANGLDINFGQRPFQYTPPTGYQALCTTNLPTPTILKGNSYMDATLYTGTGSSLNVTGVNFQPDFVWIKERVGAADHGLYDAVRGVQKQLESNTTTDETTETTGLTAFNSDGFTVGALAQLNTNTDTYVAWSWKETATSGFDIVTYTGNGSNRTISHGLGVAPKMIIVKARTTASTDQGWPVYHASNTTAPETDYLLLNSTAATADLDTVWNDTAPTSSVFSVGTNALVNTNNDTYVAYCFADIAGYSKAFSYTGNGSSDGPMVYLGFRPKFILTKSSTGAYSWYIEDTSRSTYNVIGSTLAPNTSSAEDNAWGANKRMDVLSNGFKIRASTLETNENGATFIGIAFAENPFKNSLAR